MDALSGALVLTGAREHSVYQRCNFDPSCDWVLADRDQIQRVLVNLFPNALKKAMVSSTHFASKNKAADAMIEITVLDRMCGRKQTSSAGAAFRFTLPGPPKI